MKIYGKEINSCLNCPACIHHELCTITWRNIPKENRFIDREPPKWCPLPDRKEK